VRPRRGVYLRVCFCETEVDTLLCCRKQANVRVATLINVCVWSLIYISLGSQTRRIFVLLLDRALQNGNVIFGCYVVTTSSALQRVARRKHSICGCKLKTPPQYLGYYSAWIFRSFREIPTEWRKLRHHLPCIIIFKALYTNHRHSLLCR